MKSIIKLLWILGWLLVGHLAIADTVSAQLERELFTFLPFIEGGGSTGVPIVTLNKWRDDIEKSVNRTDCTWIDTGDSGAESSSGIENPIGKLSGDIINTLNEKHPHSRVSQILVCPSDANGINQHVVSVILTMPDPTWTASYYNGRQFNNVLAIEKFEHLSNLNWGTEAPPINQPGIRANDFSIIFERTILFTDKYYEFEAQADDCISVSFGELNDRKDRYEYRLVIDRKCNINEIYKYNTILDGLYRVRVEYYEGGGNASLDFGYEGFQYWNASYFNNKNLDSRPVLQREEPIKSRQQLEYIWEGGSPGNGVRSDQWSAQWEGEFSFAAAEYEFWTESDDGVRVFLDKDKTNPIFDKWIEGGDKKFCEKRFIDAGLHTVNVDYYENRGKAKIKVWWKRHGESTANGSLCTPNSGPCVEQQIDRCEDYNP